MNDLLKLIEQYSDNKLAIGLVSAILGAVLTFSLPKLYAALSTLSRFMVSRFSGKISFRALQGYYLNWVVTDQRGLKLAGVVNADEAKKPSLEQVFVSLSVTHRQPGEQKVDSTRAESAGLASIKTWSELEELLQLHSTISNNSVPLKDVKRTRKAFVRDTESARRGGNADESALQEAEYAKVQAWIALEASTLALTDTFGHFQLRKVLREHDRVAILGSPGAGKTTLLQYIALTFARERAANPALREKGLLKRRFGPRRWRLPIFIRLSSIASRLAVEDDKTGAPALVDLIPLTLPGDLQNKPGIKQFFLSKLQRGKCLVLLDGLDEVPTDPEFKAVVRAIESMATMYSDNQYVLTSRIAGWRGGVGADFDTYYVEDLTKTQTDTFIDIWYEAVEKNAVTGSLKKESSAEKAAREWRAQEHASELKRALEQNAGIRRLAVNPMLLSIIALLHRSLAILPKDRTKLYDECTKLLLNQWDYSREVWQNDTNLMLEQKEAIMRQVAYSYHTGAIGDSGGGREASLDEVKQIVAEMLPNFGKDAASASHLVNLLIERSGVLVERRRSVLGFSHHTFQEYFTARSLASKNEAASIKFLVDPARILSDWWREVILLYAGLVPDTAGLIRAIYQREIDNVFQYRLRLAASCMDEAIEIKDVALRTEVANRLKCVRLEGRIEEPDIPLQTEEINYLVQWAKGTEWQRAATVASLRSGKAHRFASYLAEIQDALASDTNIANAIAAVESIPAVPPASLPDALVDQLLEKLPGADPALRQAIVTALVSVAPGHPSDSKIEHALIGATSDNHKGVREAAVLGITTRGIADHAAFLRWFVNMIRTESLSPEQWAPVLAKRFVAAFEGRPPPSLLNLLGERPGLIFTGVIEAILQFSDKSYIEAEVIEPIVSLLESASGRDMDMEILGRLTPPYVTARVIDVLVKTLSREGKGINLRAMAALARLGQASPAVVAEGALRVLDTAAMPLSELMLMVLIRIQAPAGFSFPVEALLRKISQAEGREKVLAICVISKTRNAREHPEVAAVLSRLLHDPAPIIRAAAICAIGRLHAESFDQAVLADLFKAGAEVDDLVRLASITAVAEVGIDGQRADHIDIMMSLLDMMRTWMEKFDDRSAWRRLFASKKMRRRYNMRLGWHVACVKVLSTSRSNRIYASLIDFYAVERHFFEEGVYFESPSDFFTLILLVESASISRLLGDFHYSFQSLRYRFLGSFSLPGTAQTDYETFLYFRPGGLVRLENDDRFLQVLATSFIDAGTQIARLSIFLQHQQQHMQRIACMMLGAAGTELDINALRIPIAHALQSRSTYVVQSLLDTLQKFDPRNMDGQILAAVRRHLQSEKPALREAAWETLHGTASQASAAGEPVRTAA